MSNNFSLHPDGKNVSMLKFIPTESIIGKGKIQRARQNPPVGAVLLVLLFLQHPETWRPPLKG